MVVRAQLDVRDADQGDARGLAEAWADLLAGIGTRAMPAPATADVEQALARAAERGDERLVVAVDDGAVVGFAHLARGALSPVHPPRAVIVSYLHVMPTSRRRGVGRALLAEATSWAEHLGVAQVVVTAPAAARESNRFFARLGLGQVAIVRAATTTALRAKLSGDAADAATRRVVVARRRSLRERRPRSLATRP